MSQRGLGQSPEDNTGIQDELASARRAELLEGLAAQGAEARRAEARANQTWKQLPRRGKPAGIALKGRRPSLPCR